MENSVKSAIKSLAAGGNNKVAVDVRQKAYDAVAARMSEKARQLALDSGLAAAGFGLTVASAPILLKQFRDLIIRKRPVIDESVNPDKEVVPVYKSSSSITSAAGAVLSPVFEQAGKLVQELGGAAADYSKNLVSGGKSTNILGTAYGAPAIAAGGLLGIAPTYALATALQDKLKKDIKDRELEIAKREYREALRGKTKRAQELHAGLDCVYDKLCKEAMTLEDFLAGGLGINLATGLAATAPGFLIGKQIADKYQNRRLLEEAIKLRRRRKYLKSPIPISLQHEMLSQNDNEEPAQTPKAAPSLV